MTVYEGVFEEVLAHRAELAGKRVRVEVIGEPVKASEVGKTPEERVSAYLAWVGAPRPVRDQMDDSRESIYSGTIDDPR
ncbi:MAG TPA: hypothetical protein VH253_14995 [Phycisphaerae bacterium]|nr:hypothetical protein [Phycisphaerae bacterium]